MTVTYNNNIIGWISLIIIIIIIMITIYWFYYYYISNPQHDSQSVSKPNSPSDPVVNPEKLPTIEKTPDQLRYFLPTKDYKNMTIIGFSKTLNIRNNFSIHSMHVDSLVNGDYIQALFSDSDLSEYQITFEQENNKLYLLSKGIRRHISYDWNYLAFLKLETILLLEQNKSLSEDSTSKSESIGTETKLVTINETNYPDNKVHYYLMRADGSILYGDKYTFGANWFWNYTFVNVMPWEFEVSPDKIKTITGKKLYPIELLLNPT